ncbi:MAG TPA: lysophospholipid acyltransferase family protein [Planctomycetota bacterium]|nr:lysophospholipid acyltransferase family protein [Planctomycetota bacterium]
MMVRLVRFLLYIWMRIFHGLQFHGTSNIPKNGPVIVAANHPSYFDPVVLSLATGRLVRFFALAEITKLPLIGWFTRQWGILPVYRGGNNEPTVQKALRILQRGGAIGIFPEGRRSLQWAMGEPKPGVGRLAVQSGAKIVPCVIYGTWKAWPRLTGLPHPSKIVVDFLPAIDVEPMDTRENHEKIARRVRDLIVEEQLKHRVGPAPSGAYREAPDY